ncbi:hypothetical protein HDU89_007790 [Geranomyces variabilis]|nr:hypothetical protein HDU89_007790 [Geranomyces variabilis]
MISHISPSISRESMSSPAPAIKPRRKPVNYDGVTAAPNSAQPTSSASAVLGPRKFEGSSARLAVPLQGGTSAVESPRLPHRMDHGPFPVQNPLPPPPRRATIVSTRSGLKPVTAGPSHAGSIARNVVGEDVALVETGRVPASPVKLKGQFGHTVSDNESLKRQFQELKEKYDNLKLEKEEAVLKYRRRAHFGMARPDSSLTDQLKELTADMETRRLEQQDLHAAIELLVRRTAALEQQVLSLGGQPVTKTDSALSEARLEEIASGVWKKFEHLGGKADSSTSRTNSVMTDILAKTREIRRHLNLSLSSNNSTDASTSSIKSAAPAAESPSTASSPISTHSTDLPTGPPPPPPPKKKRAAVVVVDRTPSPAEQRTAKPPALPERVKDDLPPTAEKLISIAACAGPEVMEVLVPEKVPVTQPMPVEAVNTTTEQKPADETETTAVVETTKREGAFADDLLAIMNDFGF